MIFHAETQGGAGEMFSHCWSSLFVDEELVPVGPVKAGLLGAVSSFSADVAGGTAARHVAAAHRLRTGQRNQSTYKQTSGVLSYKLHYRNVIIYVIHLKAVLLWSIFLLFLFDRFVSLE